MGRLIIIFILLLQFTAYCQFGRIKHPAEVKADSLYILKQYAQAAQNYSVALKQIELTAHKTREQLEFSEITMINAASCFAYAGQPDAAFVVLNKMVACAKPNRESYTQFKSELKQLQIELAFIKKDVRWNYLFNEIDRRTLIAEKKINQPLKSRLDSIFMKRQYAPPTAESQKDTTGILFIERLLNTRGWPYEDSIGEYAANQFFHTVLNGNFFDHQHINSLREAVAKGQAEAYMLAYLEDALLLREGKKQIYGTQVKKDKSDPHIWDKENVNSRRKYLGLEPIEDYYLFGHNLKYPVTKGDTELKKNNNFYVYAGIAFIALMILMFFALKGKR